MKQPTKAQLKKNLASALFKLKIANERPVRNERAREMLIDKDKRIAELEEEVKESLINPSKSDMDAICAINGI